MNKNEAEAVIKDTIEFANKEIENNKKKTRRCVVGLILGLILLIAAGIIFIQKNAPTKSAEITITNIREYSQNADGTWVCDGNTYKYKLEITGRMPNASCDSTFVYLSNSEDITLEQAWKAAGFSSNLNDYLDVEDAVLVGMSAE